jgi:protein-S-isoprenylcysteine O-methyltransferase Ste14
MISSLIRHLFAILALPITAAVIIPFWIARRYAVEYDLPTNFQATIMQTFGVAIFIVGLVLFSASLYHFATQGRGTLAPWDPPRRLVVRGPYRFVRNPMISGVIFILAGRSTSARVAATRRMGCPLHRSQPYLHSLGGGAAARSPLWRALPALQAGSSSFYPTIAPLGSRK